MYKWGVSLILINTQMFSCFGRRKPEPNNAKFKKLHYSIKSHGTGKMLDVRESDGQDNTLIIWDATNGDNQRFTIKQQGPDFYLKCLKNGLYLTVEGPQNGVRVYGTTKNMGENQRFRLTETEPGSGLYAIYTHFGKVLDVSEAKDENGTVITQYDYTGKDHQLWTLCDSGDASTSSASSETKK